MLDGPYPHENREITLTTTWSGTATNPFTGETQTIKDYRSRTWCLSSVFRLGLRAKVAVI